MYYTPEQTKRLISAFRAPSLRDYPELYGYTRDQLYEDCFGGGGLYLAARMARTLHLEAGDIVLDLGCGKGSTSIFLVKAFNVKVIAVDLWTSATFLDRKFATHGYRDRIVPLQMDITHPLPFAEDYFDAVFCMNSFSFYGGSNEFLHHLFNHLKPGAQLSIGSEVLSEEFTEAQMQNPPAVYAFNLPPPNEYVNVFEGDFKNQHTPRWWQNLFAGSGLIQVECCHEIEDADVLYEEMVRYEYEHGIDPFDVDMCLAQMDWGRTHKPRKTLFVVTAHKLS